MPTRILATAIKDARETGTSWADLAADCGLLYGWPWWNVLVTRGVRAERGQLGRVVAGSPAMWRLVGRLPLGKPLEWLIPVTLHRRFVAGREIPAGEFVAGRMDSRVDVVGTERSSILLQTVDREYPRLPGLADIVGGWAVGSGLAAASRMTMVETVESVSFGWLTDSVQPSAVVEALTGGVAPVGVVRRAAASAATVGFLASHGYGIDDQTRDDLDWLIQSAIETVESAQVGLSSILDLASTLTATMRRAWARPAWSGGMLDWVTPSPLLVPSPRIGEHDAMVRR